MYKIYDIKYNKRSMYLNYTKRYIKKNTFIYVKWWNLGTWGYFGVLGKICRVSSLVGGFNVWRGRWSCWRRVHLGGS